MRPAFILVLLLAGPAAASSTGTFRLALIEPSLPYAEIAMGQPLEHLFRSAPSRASPIDLLTAAGAYADGEFRFRLPSGWNFPATGEALLLELGSEAVLIYPKDEGLAAALGEAARDPAAFRRRPRRLDFRSRTIAMSLPEHPDGGRLATARMDPARGETARWRHTVLSAHKIRWQGEERLVVMVARMFAGFGRLAAALRQENDPGLPWIGVARGDLFGDQYMRIDGAELSRLLRRIGLRYSAISGGELRNWPLLQQYLRAEPEGVRFLCANLVYSSAPATTVAQPYAIETVGGIRVALTGVTYPRAAKYLKQAGLAHAQLLDPNVALAPLLARLRAQADVVVLLAGLGEETRRLRESPGIDIVIGEDWAAAGVADPPAAARVTQARRRPYGPPLWTMRAWNAGLSLLDVSLGGPADQPDWELRERHVLLDDSIPPEPGFPDFDPEEFGITQTTGAALLPAAHEIFPEGRPGDQGPMVGPYEFWPLAAGMLAHRTRAELGLLKVEPLGVYVPDAVAEGILRVWLRGRDPALTVTLSGARLLQLLDEADEQMRRSFSDLPPGGNIHFTYGGVGPGRTVHGAAIEPGDRYRVATSRIVADALGLDDGREDDPEGRAVSDVVLDELRRRAREGSTPEMYRDWMLGRPVRETGVWEINFRDVGANVTNTKVVRDDAFNDVPNTRIQGSDERQVGLVFKTDAEYLRGPYKWTNTLELEYARTRIRPRSGPTLTNTTANRIMGLTMATRRAGGIPLPWLARSWGPSLGLQYDGQFEPAPGVRRKTVYSALPGVEFYDGSFIRSLKLSGNIKRDMGREPPRSEAGLHFRMVFSREVGPKKALLQGEWFTDFFPRTNQDVVQDLRVEGDLNVRLRIPIYKELSIAPFLDFYYFQLKVRPIWGYSAMTGIKIGFSRFWKPQYERF